MSIINEAEEVPFQLLHGELVKHILTRSGNDRVKALSDIESIGTCVNCKLFFPCYNFTKVYKESELIALYFHMKSKQISCFLPIVVVTKLGRLQLICFDFIWK